MGYRIDLGTRKNAEETFHHHPFSRTQTLFDQPFLSTPHAGADSSELRFIFLVDDIHKRTAGPLLHSTLRNQDGLGARIAFNANLDELAGIKIGLPRRKSAFRVGKYKSPLQ